MCIFICDSLNNMLINLVEIYGNDIDVVMLMVFIMVKILVICLLLLNIVLSILNILKNKNDIDLWNLYINV